jgi:hypothetical protein
MTKEDFKALTELETPIGGETVGQYLDRMLRFQVIGLGDAITFFESIPANAKLMKANVFAIICNKEKSQ